MLNCSAGATEERTVELRLAVAERRWSDSGPANTRISTQTPLRWLAPTTKGVDRRYPLEWLVALIDEQAEGPMFSRTPHDRNEHDL
jgi:hypothetical protein